MTLSYVIYERADQVAECVITVTYTSSPELTTFFTKSIGVVTSMHQHSTYEVNNFEYSTVPRHLRVHKPI